MTDKTISPKTATAVYLLVERIACTEERIPLDIIDLASAVHDLMQKDLGATSPYYGPCGEVLDLPVTGD